MTRSLTLLLSRTVFDVPVSSASVAKSKRDKYFILVNPDHMVYWARFKAKYPNSVSLAQIRGAEVDGLACPEFDVLEDLINWLFDVLELTQGERKLLLLM